MRFANRRIFTWRWRIGPTPHRIKCTWSFFRSWSEWNIAITPRRNVWAPKAYFPVKNWSDIHNIKANIIFGRRQICAHLGWKTEQNMVNRWGVQLLSWLPNCPLDRVMNHIQIHSAEASANRYAQFDIDVFLSRTNVIELLANSVKETEMIDSVFA